jgi:adenylate cyclase
MGDACMAFWLNEDPIKSAELALLTTVKMREELKRMNEEDKVLKDDPIFIRFGVNTGEVILCDIGSAEARIDLTIIGDSVNLASRLESAAKQYGIDNLISELTIKPLLNKFHARMIDIVKVKGKNKPVECYELLGLKSEQIEKSNELVNLFSNGFEEYKNGNFIKAKQIFQKSLALEKNQEGLNPSKVFIKRCLFLLRNKPKEWSGVWKLTSK